MDAAVVESAACANCGHTLHGRFCSRCGQEAVPLDPTVGEVVGEAAREMSSLDGRILRSVRRLFLSPGFLTREYLAGRRASWMSPVRLYLTFSVVFFAVASLARGAPLNVTLRFTGDTDQETRQEMQRLGFASEQDMRLAINTALNTWTPRATFALVPVLAWLVSIARRRARKRYPQHLIFALHVLAAFFGAQAIFAAAGAISNQAVFGFLLGSVLVLYAAFYMATALRVVYGGTTRQAILHTIVVLTIYWAATVVTALAIVLPVLYSRAGG